MSPKNWARVLAGVRKLLSHEWPLRLAGCVTDPSTAPVHALAIDISDGSDGSNDICDSPDLLD